MRFALAFLLNKQSMILIDFNGGSVRTAVLIVLFLASVSHAAELEVVYNRSPEFGLSRSGDLYSPALLKSEIIKDYEDSGLIEIIRPRFARQDLSLFIFTWNDGTQQYEYTGKSIASSSKSLKYCGYMVASNTSLRDLPLNPIKTSTIEYEFGLQKGQGKYEGANLEYRSLRLVDKTKNLGNVVFFCSNPTIFFNMDALIQTIGPATKGIIQIKKYVK